MTALNSKKRLGLPKQWDHWCKRLRLKPVHYSWRKCNLRFLYLKSKTHWYVIRLSNNALNISGSTSQWCMWSNNTALTTTIPTTFDAFNQLIEAIDVLIAKQQSNEDQVIAKDIMLTGKIGVLDDLRMYTNTTGESHERTA